VSPSRLDDKTNVPLGWLLAILGAVATAGAGYIGHQVAEVHHQVAVIDKRLDIFGVPQLPPGAQVEGAELEQLPAGDVLAGR